MADKNEIDFTLNTDQGEQAAAHMNTTLDKTTAKAVSTAQAVQGVADATGAAIANMEKKLNVVISNTSDASKRRLVESTRRRVAGLETGGDPLKAELAAQERSRTILARDANLLAQANALHERAITLIKARATEELRLKAIRASQDTSASDRFLAAKRLVTQEKEKQVQANIKIRQSELNQIRQQTASPLEQLALRRNSSISRLTGAGASAAEIAEVEAGFKKLENQAVASSKNIGARIAEFITSPTYAARKSLGEFLQDFGKFGIIAGGIVIAAAAAGAAIFNLVRGAGRTAEEFGNLGERLGISASQAAVLSTQARIAGVSVDSLGGLVRKLSTTLVDGGAEAKSTVTALNSIGVSVAGVGNTFRDPVAILKDLSINLNRLPSQAAQVDLLTKAFGRGSVELLPLIKHFSELQRQAEATGIGGIGPLIKRLQEVDDKLDAVGVRVDILRLKISEKFLIVIDTIFTGGDLERYKKDLLDLSPFLKHPSEIPGPQAPQPSAADLYTSSQRQGNFLLQQFQSRQTAQGVQDQIAQLENERQHLVALAVPGRDKDVQAGNLKAIAAVEAQIEKQKELLKIINGIDAAQKAANTSALKAQKDLADAVSARTALVSGANAEDVKFAQDSAKALDHYRESQAKAREDGLYNAGIEASLRKELLAGVQTAIVNYGIENIKRIQEEGKAYREYYSERLKQELAFEAQTIQLAQATTNARLDFEETAAGHIRDAQIRAIERTNAKTLQQVVQFELQKGAIETQYVERSTQIKLDAINRAADADRVELETQRAVATNKEQFDKRISEVEKKAIEDRRQLQVNAAASIAKAQEDAAIKATQAIIDANTKVFDTFKRQSEGIFDAMLTKSQNVFQAIGNALKNALLTAVKDIVSTQSARLLTELFTGQKVGLTPTTIGTGPFSKIAQALGIGAKPTFPGVKIPTVSSTLGDAIPVVIANPEAIQQKVDIKSTAASSQVNQSLNFSGGGLSGFGGGAGRVPLTAILAVAMGLGQQAAAQNLPSGYTPVAQQTSSSIQYAGGGVQDLGSVLRRFGSDTNGITGQGSLSDLAGGSPNVLGVGGGGSSFPDLSGLGVGPSGISGGIPGLSGITGISQSAGGGGILGSLKSMLGFGGNGPNGMGTLLSPGHAIGTASLGGKIAAGAASPLATMLGLGLLFSAIKNPYGKLSAVKAGAGGALAGFGIGSQIPGVGGLPGAGIGAGIGLFANGYQRGGGIGALETAAGGALTGASVGFLVGGPLGAAIGAAVGGAVGLGIGALRWAGILSSKSEKIHNQIKSIYGIDIRDRRVVEQIKQIIDQQYGGNVEVGVRSLGVRQFVELYAQSTGQNARGIVDRAQASVFANQGGRLTQMPTYFNGSAVLPGQTSSTIGIPTLNPNGGYSLSPVVGGANASHTTILSLDGPTTAAVLQGQAKAVIVNSPRLISDQTNAGMSASASRRDISAGVLSPSFLSA